MTEPFDRAGLTPGMRLDDAELWRCVDATLTDVILPAIGDDEAWARTVAVQLIGLARYAARRPPDDIRSQVDELAAVLDSLAANPIVAEIWPGGRSVAEVLAVTSAALATAVTRDDPAADEIRAVLRPVVVRQLDDELAHTSPLVGAFRGSLDA